MHTARFLASILLVSECWLMWWNRHSRCCRRRLFALGNFSAILRAENNSEKKQLGPFSINHSSHFNFDEGRKTKTEPPFWHFVARLQLPISLFSNLWRVHRKPTEKSHFYHHICARDFFFNSPHICSQFVTTIHPETTVSLQLGHKRESYSPSQLTLSILCPLFLQSTHPAFIVLKYKKASREFPQVNLSVH